MSKDFNTPSDRYIRDAFFGPNSSSYGPYDWKARAEAAESALAALIKDAQICANGTPFHCDGCICEVCQAAERILAEKK